MRHWLLKSEPEVYSIRDLARERRTRWTGVRNYQARNFMTKDMRVGDLALFYHSNATPSGVAGLVEISAEAAPDETQFRRGALHERRATKQKPVWFCVEVAYLAEAGALVSLEALRAEPALSKMELLRKGSRLSIQPVEPEAFAIVRRLARL